MTPAPEPGPAGGSTTPSPGDLADLSAIFSALSDPTRLRVIYCILGRERSVGELAAELDLSESSVSQHLRPLRLLRVVRVRRAGRHHFYQLDDEHVTTLLSVCLEHVQVG